MCQYGIMIRPGSDRLLLEIRTQHRSRPLAVAQEMSITWDKVTSGSDRPSKIQQGLRLGTVPETIGVGVGCRQLLQRESVVQPFGISTCRG